MKKLVLFLSLILFTFGALAEVYKWKDSNGNIHFSDAPHDGAEKMNILDTQSGSVPKSNTGNSSGSNSSESDSDQDNKSAERQQYTGVEIAEPKNEVTIRNDDGSVTIQVKVTPELYEKDNVQIIYDGTPIGDPQHNLIFKLKGMLKGTHKLTVQVVDLDGKVLIASEPSTFFMQRPGVGKGNTIKTSNQEPNF